jgi:hypothetical protein
MGQDSLCVFNIKGNAYTKINNTINPVKKGSFINSESILVVDTSTKITAINSNGDVFKIQEEGIYNFPQIIKFKIKDSKNLTVKYFKLIWDEFMNNKANKTEIGGVFRGDVLMKYPLDHIQWASSKLTFNWKTKSETSSYFLFIRNVKTGEILKISTDGTQMTLYKDQHIFSQGNEFEWSVSSTEFPNLKNIPFFSFKLIDRKAYTALMTDYKDLIQDLKSLGLSDNEIETSICETYGLCKTK